MYMNRFFNMHWTETNIVTNTVALLGMDEGIDKAWASTLKIKLLFSIRRSLL